LEKSDRHEEALARFRTIHQQQRQSRYWPDATYRLAAAALKAGQYDAVHCLVADVCECQTTLPDVLGHALLLETQAAAARCDWLDVEKSATELMARLPESQLLPAAKFWMAEAAYRRQQTEEATKRFQQLANRPICPADSRESWRALIPLRRGQLAATTHDWNTARAMVAQLHRDWPGCEQQQEVDYLEGRCLAAEARFDEAREAYQRALRAHGRDKTETAAMAQWMIGESYLHQEKFEAALKEYLRVEILYAYPQWQAAALIEAGRCYEALGRKPEAAAVYQRILDKYAQTTFCDEARKRLQSAAASPSPPSSPRDAAAVPTFQGRTQQR
jgi:TolA-binding protein